MNIGIVTTWFERGAAYVSKQYKELLEEAGNTVFVYARGGEVDAVDKSKWGGERITWAKHVPFPLPTYVDCGDFKDWIRRNKIETVFFNEQRWLKPVLICKDLGVKTGLYVDYYTEESLPAFDAFDFLVCNTRKHFSAFDWHEQVYYVPWGTDIDLFNSSVNRDKSDKVRFFTSSGMNPYRKGTDLVIEAFAECVKLYSIVGQVELVVHTQVSLSEFFKDKSSTLKALDHLLSLGVLRVIEGTFGAPGLYHEGDVYVYPSRLDGIGLTVAEALSCAMPVIVPNDGPMNEFLPKIGSSVVEIQRYFCRADAYYWPQNEVSIPALAAAMMKYVDERHLLHSFSTAAREYAVNNLDWSSRLDEISCVFESSKIRPISLATKRRAERAFTSGFPRVWKYESIYRLMYSALSYFKKST